MAVVHQEAFVRLPEPVSPSAASDKRDKMRGASPKLSRDSRHLCEFRRGLPPANISAGKGALLRNRILDHWRTYRPTLLRDLERSGELEAVIASLERTIRERQGRLLAQGMSLEQADDLLKSMWMIFEHESDLVAFQDSNK